MNEYQRNNQYIRKKQTNLITFQALPLIIFVLVYVIDFILNQYFPTSIQINIQETDHIQILKVNTREHFSFV